MIEDEERAYLVKVAHGWLRTPYRHAARVKGAGCDCLTLLAEVFEEAGLVPHVPIPRYVRDWHLHRGVELYLNGLLQYAREIEGPPKPGDIVLWQFGRCFSHGAIVVQWPLVIHSWVGVGCVLEDVDKAAWLEQRTKRYFSYWSK